LQSEFELHALPLAQSGEQLGFWHRPFLHWRPDGHVEPVHSFSQKPHVTSMYMCFAMLGHGSLG
jgi:hypothetical protein